MRECICTACAEKLPEWATKGLQWLEESALLSQSKKHFHSPITYKLKGGICYLYDKNGCIGQCSKKALKALIKLGKEVYS